MKVDNLELGLGVAKVVRLVVEMALLLVTVRAEGLAKQWVWVLESMLGEVLVEEWVKELEQEWVLM